MEELELSGDVNCLLEQHRNERHEGSQPSVKESRGHQKDDCSEEEVKHPVKRETDHSVLLKGR